LLSRPFPSNPRQTISQGGSILSEFQTFHNTMHDLGDFRTSTFNWNETLPSKSGGSGLKIVSKPG